MSDDDNAELIRRAEARVGTTLKDKWTVDKLLGVGGMAVVYAATHRNKKRVAIKMLHPQLSVDPDIRQRFLREGYVANTVDHPGAVMVDDDDVAEDGAAFIVMELLQGETAQARMDRKGGRLPADEVLSIANQLLDVLVAAHDKGIIHRDLKPENLFLDRSGQLKVLDFGIARLREGKERSGTRTGSLLGTPSYMPPEQARGRWDDVDRRTDLWAVGATMYALLTGRLVHEAETANEALALAITQRAPALASVMPEAPPAVAAVVDRALTYEMDGRYPDAASMQNAVREVYAGLHDVPAGGRLPALSIANPPARGAVVLSAATPGAGAESAIGAVQAQNAPSAAATGYESAQGVVAPPGFASVPPPPGFASVPPPPGFASVPPPPGVQPAPAASPTAAGMTRSAPLPSAKKLPIVPMVIAAGAALVAIVGIIIVVVAVHAHSSVAAPASAPAAGSALTGKQPTPSAHPVVTPATAQPDDQGAVNIDDLPAAGQKNKGQKVGSTDAHDTATEHKAVAAERPARRRAAKHHHTAPKVSEDPFAKRR